MGMNNADYSYINRLNKLVVTNIKLEFLTQKEVFYTYRNIGSNHPEFGLERVRISGIEVYMIQQVLYYFSPMSVCQILNFYQNTFCHRNPWPGNIRYSSNKMLMAGFPLQRWVLVLNWNVFSVDCVIYRQNLRSVTVRMKWKCATNEIYEFDFSKVTYWRQYEEKIF